MKKQRILWWSECIDGVSKDMWVVWCLGVLVGFCLLLSIVDSPRLKR
jgi:hypothetical protein